MIKRSSGGFPVVASMILFCVSFIFHPFASSAASEVSAGPPAGRTTVQLKGNAPQSTAPADEKKSDCKYVGSAAGTFSGDDSGTWDAFVNSGCKISGSGHSEEVGNFTVTGNVSSGGKIRMVAGSATTGAVFDGQIAGSGAISGSWRNALWAETGTFEGTFSSYAIPPIDIGEISFNWGEESSAINLKARVNKADVAVPIPEYVKGAASEPAAYVRNAAVTIQARFVANSPLNQVTVWAEGSLGGLPKKTVDFGGATSSPSVDFTALKRLPNKIGVNKIVWKWKYMGLDGKVRDMGKTSHVAYTSFAAPLSTPVYKELMAWTADWASNLGNEKQITDAIIRKLGRSGMQYGMAAWDTATMLDAGGGMCGGWSQMFADMAATHGVFLHRRCFILQNDAVPSPEAKWLYIVIKAAGLNRSEPATDPWNWGDVDKKSAYPYPLYLGNLSKKDDVNYVTEKRWAFASPYDGHCIDFLEYDGKVYLYDPSFGKGPFNNTFTSVPSGSMTGTALSTFRTNYHDKAIDYLRGVIAYRSCRTCEPETDPSFELDVKTKNIPALRDPATPETFEMHYIWD